MVSSWGKSRWWSKWRRWRKRKLLRCFLLFVYFRKGVCPIIYKLFKCFFYDDNVLDIEGSDSSALFTIADRLQKLYGGKVYVGLRIPDADSASRQSIDVVLVTKGDCWENRQFCSLCIAFALALLVTPLEALSIIFSAVLAHFILEERYHIFGVLGRVLCMVGSTIIVLHAPHERIIHFVKEVWQLTTEPGFIIYTVAVVILVSVLIFYCVPKYGQKQLVIYVGTYSLTGSLTVMGVKAVGIALKLSFEGTNQFIYFQT